MINTKLSRRLCQAIEELPASGQQTYISELANELSINVEFAELHALAAINSWTLPVNNVFSKVTWNCYWQQ